MGGVVEWEGCGAMHAIPSVDRRMLLLSRRMLPLLPGSTSQVAVVAGVNRDVMLLRVGQVRLGRWFGGGRSGAKGGQAK